MFLVFAMAGFLFLAVCAGLSGHARLPYTPAPGRLKPGYVPGGVISIQAPASAATGERTWQWGKIHVNYLGTWDPQARSAFEYAKHIWEMQLSIPVTVEVDAYWIPIPGNALGSSYPATLFKDFAGAPLTNTYYAAAVANQLAGSDVYTGGAEILAQFNSAFNPAPGQGWYFGTDGNVDANHWDFVTVVLHELGHGLGFDHTMDYIDGYGYWGIGDDPTYPKIYDQYVVNGANDQLIVAFPNKTTALGAQLVSGDLFFGGNHATAANGGQPPRLYAPNPWEMGSSIGHLDEALFPPGGGNGLMSPSLMNGEAIHTPGAVALGMLEDLGWNLPLYLPLLLR
jgi:hypothetical protein